VKRWSQGRQYRSVKEGMLSIRHDSLLVTIFVRRQSVKVEDRKSFIVMVSREERGDGIAPTTCSYTSLYESTSFPLDVF